MSIYRLQQPMPPGVPPDLGAYAHVWVEVPADQERGRLVIESESGMLAVAIRARLARAYGFRGAPLGEQLTKDDLHCAMALGIMRPFRPRWQVDT